MIVAASIVTHVDDEARQKDLTKLEKEVNKVLDAYKAEREQRTQELAEGLERRVAWLEDEGTKDAFDGDGPSYVFDPLWGEPAAAAIRAAVPRATIVNLGQSAGATAGSSGARKCMATGTL